jgi:Txe/YoeB family toxin of Txe-Axe toxin-antitoxin module
MPEYIVKMYKTAENDYEELKRACQKDKIDSLLELISKDPFVTPPKYEELSGKYRRGDLFPQDQQEGSSWSTK